MKKQILKITIALLVTYSYAQEAEDVVLPKESPFQLGADVEGVIQNSVNETTGKLVFSVPITAISDHDLSYPVSLSYNGAIALKTAENTNEYNPTGIVGLGFDMAVPKIVADYKGTATIEDDTYYLLFGNASKLICTARSDSNLEFKTETYNLWKISYDLTANYWTLINEEGVIYQFGALGEEAKVMISTWGNWIGDSIVSPSGSIPTEWYLYRISDQWNNQLTFSYDKITGKQNSGQTAYFHTEAIYLEEIRSSNGSKIEFVYTDKLIDEYFEPHIEQSYEPDAYQEKYDKKYLQEIKTYNTRGDLLYKHDLSYETLHYSYPIDAEQYRRKRYLTEITQKNDVGESLPPQKFDYHTSGDFNGCIEKITYPMGGSVNYSYTKKNLFYNSVNRFTGTQPSTADYYYDAVCVRDAYTLKLFRSKNEISEGKYRYKAIRYQWNGTHWTANEFVLPKLIKPERDLERLDEVKMVFADDFYGFLFFDRYTDRGDLYLFSLAPDGLSWNSKVFSDINCGMDALIDYGIYGGDGFAVRYTNDPVLLNGANFVAIGSKKRGYLHTYTLKNNEWSHDLINQNQGEYYYGATNNFILSLNEDGGTDMVTGRSNVDHYYIHYLDLEQQWQTKSWTDYVRPRIASVERASHFYPNNSMAAFVADDNPEYFFRWNTQYNLVGIDNVLGAYDDRCPVYASSNALFTLHNFFYKNPYKSARFNGTNWSVFTPNSDHTFASPSNSRDLILWKRDHEIGYSRFDANHNAWGSGSFDIPYLMEDNYATTAIANKFFIAGNSLYYNEYSYILSANFEYIKTLNYDNAFSYSNGRGHVFVKQEVPGRSGTFEKSELFFIDKTTGRLASIDLGAKYHMKSNHGKFGGHTAFMSGNTVYLRSERSTFTPYLYRIINDRINNWVTDVVVHSMTIDDANNQSRQIDYEFEDFHFLANETTHYGETTIENKGFGMENNGKVVKYFNNGKTDIRLMGLPEKYEVRDAANLLKKENLYTYSLFEKDYTSAGTSYTVLNSSKTEKIFLANGVVETDERYDYDTYGRLVKTTKENSQSDIETKEIVYAADYFLTHKNMWKQPKFTYKKIDNTMAATTEVKWKEDNGNVYPYQNWAGITTTKLQKEVIRIDDKGIVLEENNGKGISSVVLMGYNYQYPVAEIGNATFDEVIDNLDISYATLQTRSTQTLKSELLKLYDRIPHASFSLIFYDHYGNITNKVDSRKEELYYHYDNFQRLSYTTDKEGNKLKETRYNYKE